MPRLAVALALLGVFALSLAVRADEAPTDEPATGLANPASQYCVSLGGRLEIRSEQNGEVGYCHLPDGRVVEEWELFRAKTE